MEKSGEAWDFASITCFYATSLNTLNVTKWKFTKKHQWLNSKLLQMETLLQKPPTGIESAEDPTLNLVPTLGPRSDLLARRQNLVLRLVTNSHAISDR